MADPSDNPMLRYWMYEPDLGGDSDWEPTTADVNARMPQPGLTGWLRGLAPDVTQADDSSVWSGITSRLARTGTGLVHSGLNTAANWLDQKPEIGPDTLAPLGLAPMGMGFIPKGAVGSGMADLLHHGSPTKGLTELTPSTRGPLGPGVYATPAEQIARGYYAGPEGHVYNLPEKTRDIYRGHGHRTDDEWHGFKADKQRLIDAADENMKPQVSEIVEKMWSNDGYPLYQRLRGLYGSDEAAQALYQKAGFEGLSGLVDGPEVLLFGKQSLNSLPMDEASRLNRAREMGFDERDFYHGTQSAPFDAFDMDRAQKGWRGKAVHTSENPDQAAFYGGDVHGDGVSVMPLKLRIKNTADYTTTRIPPEEFTPEQLAKLNENWRSAIKETGITPDIVADTFGSTFNLSLLQKLGYDSMKEGAHHMVFDPVNVRSKYAAFNPLDSDKAGLLLSDQSRASVPGTVVNAMAEAAEPQGIRAYHGSPHDFDKFDTTKIGTGEGAQAYGHGLYFAEHEATAKSYKDALAHKGVDWDRIKGYDRSLPLSDEHAAWVYRQIHYPSGTPEEAAKHMQWANADLRQQPVEKLAAVIERARKDGEGRMYEVRINADPESFLDWDKPLSQQSEAVRKAIAAVGREPAAAKISDAELAALEQQSHVARQAYDNLRKGYFEDAWKNPKKSEAEFNKLPEAYKAQSEILRAHDRINDAMREREAMTGKGIVERFADDRRTGRNNHEAAVNVSQALRDAGIPGIKYLDQGSRQAGEGSRNYVVFDANKIEILKKYGWVPVATVGGGTVMMPPAEEKQNQMLDQ